ncbi:MAG: hypothetical protein GEU83_19815 [Pseudonocardiaceae bacterium]|nr:hypothetical protein [Pseudonocardiaceae bacterium]
MIRLAVLGLYHEANTFSKQRVDSTYFEAAGVLRGEEILARHAGGTSTISGYLVAGAKHPDVELVPLVATALVPAGLITAEALRARTDELVSALS